MEIGPRPRLLYSLELVVNAIEEDAGEEDDHADGDGDDTGLMTVAYVKAAAVALAATTVAGIGGKGNLTLTAHPMSTWHA